MIPCKFIPMRSWKLPFKYSKIATANIDGPSIIGYRDIDSKLAIFKLKDSATITESGEFLYPVKWFGSKGKHVYCCGLSCGDDSNRLYGLFLSQSMSNNDLNKMWMSKLNLGLNTYCTLDIPMLSLSRNAGGTASLRDFLTLGEVRESLKDDGISGWSKLIPLTAMRRLSQILVTRGYIITVIPYWFEQYPCFFQVITLYEENTCNIIGIGVLSTVSWWLNDTPINPFISNTSYIDGKLIFRLEHIRSFFPNWVQDRYVPRWDLPNAPYSLLGNDNELMSPYNYAELDFNSFITQIKTGTLYKPVVIDLNHSFNSSPIVAKDYTSLAISSNERYMYGVYDNNLQEYFLDYAHFKIKKLDEYIDCSTPSTYFNFNPSVNTTYNLSVTNKCTRNIIKNFKFNSISGITISPNAVIGDLPINTTKNFSVTIDKSLAGVTDKLIQYSYTVFR